MKKNKFKLVPLLESGINPANTPTENQKKCLENFYLILKCRENDSIFMKNLNNGFILYNKDMKQIGNISFRIQSTLTLESSSDEIEKEIKRYFSTQHKQISMNMHPYLQPIRK